MSGQKYRGGIDARTTQEEINGFCYNCLPVESLCTAGPVGWWGYYGVGSVRNDRHFKILFRFCGGTSAESGRVCYVLVISITNDSANLAAALLQK